MNDNEFLQLNLPQQKYLLKGKQSEASHLKSQLLMQACSSGHLDTVKLLIEQGADVNRGFYEAHNSFYTPVLKAIIAGHADVLICLVENDAKIDDKQNLQLAVSLGKIDIIECLTLSHAPFWDELTSGSYIGAISQNILKWIEARKIMLDREKLELGVDRVNSVQTEAQKLLNKL